MLGGALTWLAFLLGTQIYVLNRAYFAVRGPDPSLQKYGDYYDQYWPVIVIRGFVGVVVFSLLAYHPDIFWKLVQAVGVFGISISDSWQSLFTIPINLTTAAGLGLVIDLALDSLSTRIPKLKQILPSSQFYERMTALQEPPTPAPEVPPADAGGQKGFMKIETSLLTVVLAGVAVLFSGCPNQSQIHQAATTADGIAMSLNNIEQLQESANAKGLISNDDSRVISTYVGAAVQVNDQLIAQIRAAKSLNPQSADSILATLDSVAKSIGLLEQQGVLHIKDLNTQQQFASYVSAVQAGIQSIRQVLAASGSSRTSAMRPLHFRPDVVALAS